MKLFWGVMLAIVSITSIASAQQGMATNYEPVDECFVQVAEGIDHDCGNVIVPEFHGADNGRTIKLGVVRLLSPAENPSEPVFFGAGGPGGSILGWPTVTSTEIAADDTIAYGQILANHDLVYFAQRGTKYSEPYLICPEADKATEEAYLTGLSDSQREENWFAALKGCRDQYVAWGVDLNAYNSLENAADVNSIREAFGYDRIIYYGQSYGTMLGQHILRDYPDILSAMILDGSTSLSFTTWVQDVARSYQIVLERLAAYCQADSACNRAFPNVLEDLNTAYQQLRDNPATMTVGEGEQTLQLTITGQTLAAAIYSTMADSGMLGLMPMAIHDLSQGELSDMAKGLLGGAFSPSAEVAWFMHYGFVCAEDPVYANSIEQVDGLDQNTPDMIRAYVEHDTAGYASVCELMNVAVLPDETDVNVTSDLPVLFLNGYLDKATPNFRSEEVASTLPNSFTFVFPYGTHVQASGGRSGCAVDIMRQFISDPSTKPDGSCINAIPPIQFLVQQ